MSFAERIKIASIRHSSRIVLALDISGTEKQDIVERSINIMEQASPYVAAVKVNYHLLLPLGLFDDVKRIVDVAHKLDLQVIADLKLNDIASTNLVATSYLWWAEFDAVIVNPIVGYEGGLGPVVEEANKKRRGVILLVYMSNPGAVEVYGASLSKRYEEGEMRVHRIFSEKALRWGVDGVIVGATNPSIVREVFEYVRGRVLIFSPGVGAQGADVQETIRAGSDFIIVGRAIVKAEDVPSRAREICQAAFDI